MGAARRRSGARPVSNVGASLATQVVEVEVVEMVEVVDAPRSALHDHMWSLSCHILGFLRVQVLHPKAGVAPSGATSSVASSA